MTTKSHLITPENVPLDPSKTDYARSHPPWCPLTGQDEDYKKQTDPKTSYTD